MKKTILTVAVIAASLLVTSCEKAEKTTEKKDTTEETTTHEHAGGEAHSHDAAQKKEEKGEGVEKEISTTLTNEQAKTILAAYLEVKDALVQTDGKAASKAAEKLVGDLGDTKDELAEKIRFDAEHIWSTKDAGHQRDHFNALSKNVYSLVKHTQANTAPLYLQSCAMQKNNREALWLSLDSGIKNPYFGDKMLTCGNTENVLATVE